MSYQLSKPYHDFDTSEEILDEVSKALIAGKGPIVITVREFLLWFDTQRRGPNKVAWINQLLEVYNLLTLPDYTTTYIDENIEVQSSTAQDGVSSVSDINAGLNISDPVLRIGSLPSANMTLITVAPDHTLGSAVTLMMAHGFSQLPVITSPREVKGVISWTSIGERLASGRTGLYVRDFMIDALVVHHDASFFSTLMQIIENGYVFIRKSDNTLGGVVTTTDLGLQFQQSTEPFLLLNEIENHVRSLLQRWCKIDRDGIAHFLGLDGRYTNVFDLSFGHYVRLFQSEAMLPSPLPLHIDRDHFCNLLDKVRVIRNDVMHFSPDPTPPESIPTLRLVAKYLQTLQTLA